MRLAIGERGPGADGWHTVDLFGADFSVPMWDLRCVDAYPVTEIRCSHALEHVARDKVAPTLAEWHRVLVARGTLSIEVPDLLDTCRMVWKEMSGEGGDVERALDVLYGSQQDEGMFHRGGFTMHTLTAALIGAGFDEVAVVRVWSSHEHFNLRATAVKL